MSRRCHSTQVVIDKDKKDAAVVKEKVLVQEASATEISERAGAIAADAQADLDKALPALAAAVSTKGNTQRRIPLAIARCPHVMMWMPLLSWSRLIAFHSYSLPRPVLQLRMLFREIRLKEVGGALTMPSKSSSRGCGFRCELRSTWSCL